MSTTPTVSPTVKSTVGLKDVRIAPVSVDTASTYTAGTVQCIAGAIDATIAHATTDPDVQYADDIEFSVVYPDPEITVTMNMADIPLSIQAMILGNTLDDHGQLLRKAGDTPGYFALGFKAEKTDGTFRYVWLYKCRATPITEKYATKEGTTINRQPQEVEFTAIKRTKDGYYQVLADEGQNGFTTVMAATWLDSVAEPYFNED